MFTTRGFGHAFSAARHSFTITTKARSIRTFRTNYVSLLRGNTFSSFRCGCRRPETNLHSLLQESRHQRRGYRQQVFNYQRVIATGHIFRRWAARPTFYYEVGGIGAVCGGWYLYNLETVPVSGRRRFNVVSQAWEEKLGRSEYEQVMREYGSRMLPEYSREHQMVERVMQRLIPHAGMPGAAWEVHVIQDEQTNAFVLPGGKVFVYSGILKVCQNDDGLAAVLSHEIAHNLAHHLAERVSQALVLLPVGIVAFIAGGVDPGIFRSTSSLIFTLPGSRKAEAEADYIGLMIMSESCYDPAAAMRLWATMEKMNQGASPEFLSTHPSNHNRLENIRTWLDQANHKREMSGCGGVYQYADGFRQAVGMRG